MSKSTTKTAPIAANTESGKGKKPTTTSNFTPEDANMSSEVFEFQSLYNNLFRISYEAGLNGGNGYPLDPDIEIAKAIVAGFSPSPVAEEIFRNLIKLSNIYYYRGCQKNEERC